MTLYSLPSSFFFFNDTATTEIYTLSLHDALPISFVRRSGEVISTSCDEETRSGTASDGRLLFITASRIGTALDCAPTRNGRAPVGGKVPLTCRASSRSSRTGRRVAPPRAKLLKEVTLMPPSRHWEIHAYRYADLRAPGLGLLHLHPARDADARAGLRGAGDRERPARSADRRDHGPRRDVGAGTCGVRRSRFAGADRDPLRLADRDRVCDAGLARDDSAELRRRAEAATRVRVEDRARARCGCGDHRRNYRGRRPARGLDRRGGGRGAPPPPAPPPAGGGP